MISRFLYLAFIDAYDSQLASVWDGAGAVIT